MDLSIMSFYPRLPSNPWHSFILKTSYELRARAGAGGLQWNMVRWDVTKIEPDLSPGSSRTTEFYTDVSTEGSWKFVLSRQTNQPGVSWTLPANSSDTDVKPGTHSGFHSHERVQFLVLLRPRNELQCTYNFETIFSFWKKKWTENRSATLTAL